MNLNKTPVQPVSQTFVECAEGPCKVHKKKCVLVGNLTVTRCQRKRRGLCVVLTEALEAWSSSQKQSQDSELGPFYTSFPNAIVPQSGRRQHCVNSESSLRKQQIHRAVDREYPPSFLSEDLSKLQPHIYVIIASVSFPEKKSHSLCYTDLCRSDQKSKSVHLLALLQSGTRCLVTEKKNTRRSSTYVTNYLV